MSSGFLNSIEDRGEVVDSSTEIIDRISQQCCHALLINGTVLWIYLVLVQILTFCIVSREGDERFSKKIEVFLSVFFCFIGIAVPLLALNYCVPYVTDIKSF